MGGFLFWRIIVAKENKQVVDQVKVRVLVDCVHGKCNSVAVLENSDVEEAEKCGLVSSAPGEVAYAESIIVKVAEVVGE